MNFKVEGIVAQRKLLVVDDHPDGTSPQPACHFCNLGSALLQGAEESLIVAARCTITMSVPFGTSLSMRRSIIDVVSNGTPAFVT